MNLNCKVNRSTPSGLLLVGALMLSLLGLANAQQNLCESDRTADIQQCFDSKLQASEKKLNATYQQLMSILKKKGRTDLMQSIQSAEQLWIKSREADCNVYNVAYAGGSFAQPGYTECKTDLGIQRIQFLSTSTTGFSR